MFKISNIDIFTKKTTENTFDEPLANQNSKLKTLWFKKKYIDEWMVSSCFWRDKSY